MGRGWLARRARVMNRGLLLVWISPVLIGWRSFACDGSLDEVLPAGKDKKAAKTVLEQMGREISKETIQRPRRLACCQNVSSQSQAVWKADASKFIAANILARHLLPGA